MENKAIGLITGAIKSDGQFLALATKIRLKDGRDELLYFAFPKLKGLLFTLQTKLALMHENGTFNTAQSSQETYQEQARYRQQAMEFKDAELTAPDAKKGVKTLSTLPGDAYITLSIERVDGHQVNIDIPDAAIEIFTGYILHTLKAAGGDALMEHAISNLDFMGLYSLEYKTNGELDYKYFNQDP
uniref:YjeJ family protein n=2 Tax=Serratia TaxID=613 RepID=UPI0021C7636C